MPNPYCILHDFNINEVNFVFRDAQDAHGTRSTHYSVSGEFTSREQFDASLEQELHRTGGFQHIQRVVTRANLR